MSNSQNAVRFYIDQDEDKAVIRAVPVSNAVVSRMTHRITTTETTGEPVTVKSVSSPSRLTPAGAARSASERVGRLVRRRNATQS